MPNVRRTINAPEILERRGGYYDRRDKRRLRIARSDGKKAIKKALGAGTAQRADSVRDRHRYVGSHRRANRGISINLEAYLSKEVIRYMGVRDLVWLIIVIIVIVVVLRFLGIF